MEHYFTNNNNLIEDIHEINTKVKNTIFTFYTDNGVFSKRGLDYGTRFLLENLDIENKNSFLDVGCGCGPIGIYIAKQNDNYIVDMIDVNEKVIKLVKKAFIKNKINNGNVFISDAYKNVKNKYDMIITNPPIHAGKKKVYEIIKNSKDYLNDDGELWIVIRKDQGAKSLIKDMNNIYNFEIIKKNNGFYVLKAKKIDK